jgi:hypothetical protein
MSYTILTIPFNLKEKAEGGFLEKGFEIDDILNKYFTIEKTSNSFLHVATFNNTAIKKTAIHLFAKLNFPEEVLSKINDNLFGSSSFYDNKYLPLAKGYVNLLEIDKLNGIKINNNDLDLDVNAIPIPDRLYNNLKFIYRKNVNDPLLEFSIEQLKIFINKSHQTKNAIGFGFVEIVIKWDFSDSKKMLDNLEPFAELFRYYGKTSKNEFELSWEYYIKLEIQNISNQIQDSENRIKEGGKEDIIKNQKIGIENKKVKIEQLNKLLFKVEDNSPLQKITFKLLIDELLKPFVKVSENKDMFDFLNESHKPYILHLSNIEEENKADFLNFDDTDLIRKCFRLIRVPGSENIEINNNIDKSNYSFPDLFSGHFILNEGAIVIEGTSDPANLLNKYYPAFLLALNQKYLFNYLQEKINQLPVDLSGKYKIEDIKKLQETMIYAEFTQIFTSLSNYNEIDKFFEKLREQFKIKELKEEYLASIRGISNITQINEDENKEIREKLSDSRLNLILLLLTIAQIWPNLIPLFLGRKDGNYNLNIMFYSGMILIGLSFYFIILPLKSENKLKLKDIILKLKSLILFPLLTKLK